MSNAKAARQADLMHAITYGTRRDPQAAIKARIAELERELAAAIAAEGKGKEGRG